MKAERSNQIGKFTDGELRQLCAKSKAYAASPAGQAKQRQHDREAENRIRNPKPTKFPDLAKRITTSSSDSRAARLAILEKQSQTLPKN